MNTAAKKKQSARRFAAVASGWWMMAVCAVGAITGIVVLPVNAGASDLDYVKVSHSIDATDVKPFMIGSKRYVAMSKSFSHRPAPTDPIRIYQADANWAVGALVTTASNATRDVSGVYVFPALGDNKVLFWGAFDNYNGDRGFISQYDFNTSTWTERIINGGAYVGRIIYRPADSMFRGLSKPPPFCGF